MNETQEAYHKAVVDVLNTHKLTVDVLLEEMFDAREWAIYYKKRYEEDKDEWNMDRTLLQGHVDFLRELRQKHSKEDDATIRKWNHRADDQSRRIMELEKAAEYVLEAVGSPTYNKPFTVFLFNAVGDLRSVLKEK